MRWTLAICRRRPPLALPHGLRRGGGARRCSHARVRCTTAQPEVNQNLCLTAGTKAFAAFVAAAAGCWDRLPHMHGPHSLFAAAGAACCVVVGAELLCFLRDAVDTRKAPLMEVALDCIQKLISFKLLQGPVHHINHRCLPHDDVCCCPAGIELQPSRLSLIAQT